MSRFRSWFLLGTIFLSGAAVMVVEMTAVRTLQPFFGSTTHVWTNVIAVVLAALAIGYAAGGALADRRPSAVLLYGLMGAGGVLVALGAALVTPVSKLFLPEGIDLEGVTSVLMRGSLGTTLVVFAPAILFLGMLSPLAIRLLAEGGVGRAAGRVFALGTLGSILGTYLPTLLLVPSLGSRGSLFFAAALLILPAVLGTAVFSGRRGLFRGTATLLIGVAVFLLADKAPARGDPMLPMGGTATVETERESEYQYLTVRKDRTWNGRQITLLTINEGVYTYHSLKVKGSWLTDSRYYDDYSVLPVLLDLEPGQELRAMVVGMACGINAMQWKHFWGTYYDVRVDGAEIDPEIVRLGREYFDLPDEDWLRIFEDMDGRMLLEALPEGRRYHMIVVDAFINELYIPFHLGTREFFSLCRRRLEPGGVLAMNVYAVGRDSPNLRALRNTLATVFGHCQCVTQSWGSNFLLLARNADEPADLTRLAPGRILDRYGERARVEQWNDLVDLAANFPGLAETFRPSPGEWVLTDDHAPLEWLTDRFLAGVEEDTWRR